MPGVPFDLVLQINDSDCDGFPACNPKAEAQWDEAQTERKQAARSGGEMRSKSNFAAEIIAENADYIRAKRAGGAKKSEVIKWLTDRRVSAGLKCAGRTEMYDQLRTSGIWD
ncbi:MAG: hypothetical protein WCL10_19885 [Novosphingobium sp.]|uniref:hypothetical protein n=1 Tax=Novosphingobium sp. TaxID=1874826 RepID=UPI003015FFE4